MAILLSDKVDFRIQKITRHTERRYIITVNPPRGHSNPKCICTKQQSYKICEGKTERGKSPNTWKLNKIFLNNPWVKGKKILNTLN